MSDVQQRLQLNMSRYNCSAILQTQGISQLGQGLEKGRGEGEIKLIRTLQEILGEPVTQESELRARSLDQLQAMAADLRNRVLRRS